MTTNTDPRVEDLAALVRRLAHALDKPSGNTLLARQALDYLKRHGLQGSPLRDSAAQRCRAAAVVGPLE